MEQVTYQQVAYIGVLNEDDTLKIGIPLYVKVNGEMSVERQKMIQDIATEMLRKYDKQISEYFQKLKREQRKNESIVSGWVQQREQVFWQQFSGYRVLQPQTGTAYGKRSAMEIYHADNARTYFPCACRW